MELELEILIGKSLGYVAKEGGFKRKFWRKKKAI